MSVVLGLGPAMGESVARVHADKPVAPVEGFAHLGEQAAAFAEQAEADGARVVERGDALVVSSPDVAEEGAEGRFSRVAFDAGTGVASFDVVGVGRVRVAALDRVPAADSERDGVVTIAKGVAADGALDEVTIASSQELEQHVLLSASQVESLAAPLVLRYRVAIPDRRVDLQAAGAGLQVIVDGVAVVKVRADEAVDAAGVVHPVELRIADEPGVFEVVFDPAGRTITGAVAVDPAFASGLATGEYWMRVCNVDDGHPCEATPLADGGLPHGFASSDDGGKFRVYSSAEAGLYLGSKVGQSYAQSDEAYIVYYPTTGVDVLSVTFAGRIRDPQGANGFGCRVEIVKGGTILKSSDYETVRAGELQRNFSAYLEADAAQPGEGAALRLRKTSGATTGSMVGAPNDVRCWMPESQPTHDEILTSDRFVVKLREEVAPTVSSNPDLGLGMAGRIATLPAAVVTGSGNSAVATSEAYASTGVWHRSGQSVVIPLLGNDTHSGVRTLRARDFQGDTLGGGALVVCDSSMVAHGTERPCPNSSGIVPMSVVLSDAVSKQGVSWYQSQATDYAGNGSPWGQPVHYLYDSIKPIAPVAQVSGHAPTAEHPHTVIDTDGDVSYALTWTGGSDPGESASPRTGSGLQRIEGVFTRTGDGGTYSFSSGPGAASTGIDAYTATYSVQLRSVDRAGNSGDYGHPASFSLDTTAPTLTLQKPGASEDVSVRSWSNLPVEFDVVEDFPNDVVDEVGLRLRAHASDDDWVERPVRSNEVAAPVDEPSIAPLPSGQYQVQPYASDGAGKQFGVGASFSICADTAILPGDVFERPVNVQHLQVIAPGGVTFTKVRFERHTLLSKTKAWLIESRSSEIDSWTVAGKLVVTGAAKYELEAASSHTHWRVTPVTLGCTDTGSDDLGVLSSSVTETFTPAQKVQQSPLLGLEPYWSYRSFGLGPGMDAQVNVATGNLVMSRSLLMEPSRGMASDVSLTYNSQQIVADERLADGGIAGSNMTLSTGGGLVIWRDGPYRLSYADGDGTWHSFSATSTEAAWDGTYASPPGVFVRVRDISQPNSPTDDTNDGIAHTVMKLTTSDGVTSYFAEDAMGDALVVVARMDRSGNTIRYAYECVAVAHPGQPVQRIVPLALESGSWVARTGPAADIRNSCPDVTELPVEAGVGEHDVLSHVRRRLVEIRDPGWTESNGRHMTLRYQKSGHLMSVEGHTDGTDPRRVELSYEHTATTTRLVEVVESTRSGIASADSSERRVMTLGYDASLQDPGAWFDRSALLSTVTDAKGQPSRFRYRVPDFGRRELAAPRVSLVENRLDVSKADNIGVDFAYLIDLGAQLIGTTRITDQEGRTTTHHWDHQSPENLGLEREQVASTGMRTVSTWEQRSLTNRTRLPGRVRREAVLLVGTKPTRLAGGPIDPSASVVVESTTGRGFESRPLTLYEIDEAAGTIRRTRLSAGQDASARVELVVSYTPRGPVLEDSVTVDHASGVIEQSKLDQRLGRSIPNESWLDSESMHAPWQVSSLRHAPGQLLPASTRTLVRDVIASSDAAGTVNYAVDAAGLVTNIDAPHPNGGQARARSCRSYYTDGLLRSITDADGWSIVYWQYTLDGEPQRVSRRFRAAGGCGDPIFQLSHSAMATRGLAVAYAVSYDDDANVTCVRDLRGGTSHAVSNRFVTYSYDRLGRLKAQTTPFETRSGRRVRRLTTHTYDANSNLVRSVRDAQYEIPVEASTERDCTHALPSERGEGLALPFETADQVYDALDRVTEQRYLPNWDKPDDAHRAPRTSQTRYSRAGDVLHEIEPRGLATGDGGDYTMSYQYHQDGRLLGVRDGIGRYACQTTDQFGRVVFATTFDQQGVTDCTRLDQTRASWHVHDNAGHEVFARTVAGMQSLTRFDALGQAVRSVNVERERSAAASGFAAPTRHVSEREYGPTGLVLAEREPSRMACVAAGCDKRQMLTPETRSAYDATGREIARTDERGATTRYAYDSEGRVVLEQLPAVKVHGSSNARVSTYVHTTHDAFGNVTGVSSAMRASSLEAARARPNNWTWFAYNDDDSVAHKDDARHDNSVAYRYDAYGRMVRRIEGVDVLNPASDGWRSTASYTWYRDGSLRTQPYPVHPVEFGEHYAQDTCVGRRLRSDRDMPATVYRIAGNGVSGRLTRPFNWATVKFGGPAKKSGTVKVTKHRSRGGARHFYDENGQITRIQGCGTRIEWVRRDGIGNVLESRNNREPSNHYSYDDQGRLVALQMGDLTLRTTYHEADDDPDTIDPGVGLVASERLVSPIRKQQILGARYSYTLAGRIDRIDNFAERANRNNRNFVTSRTYHEYDRALQVARSVTQRRRPDAKFQEVLDERFERDIAGNALTITERVRIADATLRNRRATARAKKRRVPPAVVDRERRYIYDELGRLQRDKIAGIPRTYQYDEYGRMRKVTASIKVKGRMRSRVMEQSSYRSGRGNALLEWRRSRGAVDETLTVEQYRYGSGKLTGADAGAPGRMVRVVAHRGPLTTSRVRQVTRHSYLSSGQLGASQVVSYQLVKRERLVRRKRGRGFIRRSTTQNEKTSVQQERMHLDILGRRLGVSQSFQDVRRGLGVQRSATSLSYELDSQDPIVELSTSPSEPDVRRVVRSAATGRILGEMRNTGTRYAVHDHLGSVRAMLDAENQPTIQATSDFDTWGATRITRAASGTAVERQHMAYGYTGMRTNTATATTHHHARDYDPSAKTWLQTDQYVDPLEDLRLSLDPEGRDRTAYTAGNPVSFVDTSGNLRTCEGPCGGSGTSTTAKRNKAKAKVLNSHTKAVISRQRGFCVGCTTEYEDQQRRNAEGVLAQAAVARYKSDPISSPRTRTFMSGLAKAGPALDKIGTAMDALTFVELSFAPPTGGWSLLAVGPTVTARVGLRSVSASSKAIARENRALTNALRQSCLRSFSGDTKILMANGNYKPINAVRAGDWVMAANEATGDDPRPRQVTATWKHVDDLMLLYTSAGNITTTGDHPFYNAESATYEDASKLPWGAPLRTPDATRVTTRGHGAESRRDWAYNLTVSARHTYYVKVGDTSVLVHNTGPGCERAARLLDEAADGGRSSTKVHGGGPDRFFDEYGHVSTNGTRIPDARYPGEAYQFGGQRWGFRINSTGEPRIDFGSGFKVRFPE